MQMCNDTYPYRLASAVSKTELCLFTFGIGWGAEASLSAIPDQTRRARGPTPPLTSPLDPASDAVIILWLT